MTEAVATAPLPLEGDPDRGRLRLAGQDYLLIRPETLIPLCRSSDPSVQDLLEAAGRNGGAAAAGAVLAQGLTGRAALEALCASGGRIGWGRFQLAAWGPEQVAVEVANSPFAQGARDAAGPVCHLTRGVLAGMTERLLDRPIRVRETSCAARGDGVCRFELTVGRKEAPGP